MNFEKDDNLSLVVQYHHSVLGSVDGLCCFLHLFMKWLHFGNHHTIIPELKNTKLDQRVLNKFTG